MFYHTYHIISFLAINNNPFEYWITNDDPAYNDAMKKVSEFIETPGAYDVPIGDVISDAMVNQLLQKMTAIGWSGVNETRAMWQNDYKKRKIISEFIKDGLIGKKRLTSMPDRITNTINTISDGTIMRPTVINCFSGDLSSLDAWWNEWESFFFNKKITIAKKGVPSETKIYQMVQKISKSKYPSITIEEEAISVPLQTLCLAIFDGILVHMMNHVGPQTWQPLRADICAKLNTRKNLRTTQILENSYADSDIIFLQEVAGNFASIVKTTSLSTEFDVYQPSKVDGERDQISFIFLRKGKYTDVKEVTKEVTEVLAKNSNTSSKPPVADGDLLVLLGYDTELKSKFIFASFHGDTNGLATIPIVTAVRDYATFNHPDCKLLFGLDANTYDTPDADQQGVTDFAKFYTSVKLNSCYGPNPNPKNFTTFHARTHLQPQLNKAVRLEDRDIKGDKNPKDFILFFDSDFNVLSTVKDNTGRRVYIENMVFPTLDFPSDHGVTSTVLTVKK